MYFLKHIVFRYLQCILLLESKRLFSYLYKITWKLYFCISVLFIYKIFELMCLNKMLYSLDRNCHKNNCVKFSVHFFCKSNYNDHD
jgi:hypothetical protein